MGRKSRERMMTGRVSKRDGEVRYGAALKVPAADKFGPLTPKKRARLLEYMRAVPESDREGICEYLKADGGEKALALLADLEREWAAPVPPEGKD